QRRCRASDTGEKLAKTIVQILTDAALLAFADCDDLVFQPLRMFQQRQPRLHHGALFFQGRAANRDEDEEAEPHNRFPPFVPIIQVWMTRLEVSPPPNDASQQRSEDR